MQPERTAEDPNREQRRHERVDLFQELVCTSGDVAARSRVADLSVGGMFVDIPRPPFPRGTPVTVRFALHGGEPRTVVDAEVHYVQDGIGMGIRFVDLRGEDRRRIAAFVEESTARKGLGAPPLRKSARVFVQVPIRVRRCHPEEHRSRRATRDPQSRRILRDRADGVPQDDPADPSGPGRRTSLGMTGLIDSGGRLWDT